MTRRHLRSVPTAPIHRPLLAGGVEIDLARTVLPFAKRLPPLPNSLAEALEKAAADAVASADQPFPVHPDHLSDEAIVAINKFRIGLDRRALLDLSPPRQDRDYFFIVFEQALEDLGNMICGARTKPLIDADLIGDDALDALCAVHEFLYVALRQFDTLTNDELAAIALRVALALAALLHKALEAEPDVLPRLGEAA